MPSRSPRQHGRYSKYAAGCRCGLCREAMRAYKRGYYARKPISWRRYELRKNYGITLEDYARMFQQQDGCCAICKRPPQRNRLAVDHDHQTGQVRGLLCSSCNKIVGCYEAYADDIRVYLGEV